MTVTVGRANNGHVLIRHNDTTFTNEVYLDPTYTMFQLRELSTGCTILDVELPDKYYLSVDMSKVVDVSESAYAGATPLDQFENLVNTCLA